MRKKIDLYCGDSLVLLKLLSPGDVDLIITDYPWKDKAFFNKEKREEFHNEFLRLCGNTNIVVFGPPEMRWHEPFDQIAYWTKPKSTKNTSKAFSRFVEEILFYEGSDRVWNDKDMFWANYANYWDDAVDSTARSPHRKPPSLIERLIRICSNPGQTILDPFAGSMIVGEVGARLGRNFIGCELDEYTFNLNARFLLDVYGRENVDITNP
jgi:DNA modification methylase